VDDGFLSPWHDVLVRLDEYLLTTGQARELAIAVRGMVSRKLATDGSTEESHGSATEGESILISTRDLLVMNVRSSSSYITSEEHWIVAIDDFYFSAGEAESLAIILLQFAATGENRGD